MAQDERQDSGPSVLRRLARAGAVARGDGDGAGAAALTPMRALRLAFTRAADSEAGLVVTVLGITQEVVPLDDLIRLIEDDLLLVGLDGVAGLCGLAAIDLQTRAAVIEMRTMGRLRPAAAAPRPVTSADMALVMPVLGGFLAELEQTTQATPLAGWADGHKPGARLADLRAAGLALPDAQYRLVRLTLDLGAGERQGTVLLALPESRVATPAPPPDPAGDWARTLRHTLCEAPADLHAVLHRMRLSLRCIEGFTVGQVLPLPGVSVSSVRLEGRDGRFLAQARLGQMTGLRAVRLEAAPAPRIAPVPPPPRAPQAPALPNGPNPAGP